MGGQHALLVALLEDQLLGPHQTVSAQEIHRALLLEGSDDGSFVE